MEIEYKLTEDDLLAFNLYLLHQKVGRRNPILVRRFAYLIGLSIMALGTWLAGSQTFIPVAFLSMAILSFLLYPIYYHWAFRRRVSATYHDPKKRTMFSTRILRATREGLEEISGVGETKIRWEAVDDISTTETHAFISILNAHSIAIPKNNISRGDFEVFLNACKENTKGGTA